MKRQAKALIPTEWGNFWMIAYADQPEERIPHLAVVHADLNKEAPVIVRVHSECLTGDIFHSRRCDCGPQLALSMEMIAEKAGILLYLRQEGRGIGLINKLKAYNLQDQGLNTADANTHLGFEVDARQYDIAIDILQDLQVKKVRLITNNPLKLKAIDDSPVELVERIPLLIDPNRENLYYLQTKKNLFGHLLDSLSAPR